MSLSIASAVASNSLGTLQEQMAIVSRNVAGTNAPGYTARTAQIVTGFNGAPFVAGVLRATDQPLLRRLLEAASEERAAGVLADGIGRLQQSVGVDASAADEMGEASPAERIKVLASALQTLSASPADTAAAGSVISAAKAVAQGLNDATEIVRQVRQDADSSVRSSLSEVKDLLENFRRVNDAVVSGTLAGSDVSDKLDERDQLLQNLAGYLGIRTIERGNKDIVIFTDSGVTLFETTPRVLTFRASSSLRPGVSGNDVFIDGVPITGSNSAFATRAGKISGLMQLRDEIAPQFQSQLDEIARGLIVSFAEEDQTGGGLPALPGLFTYSGSTVPPSGVIPGLAGEIRVNPNVDPTQGGDVKRLRDGGISAPANPAYLYNRSNAVGYVGRINQLIAGLSAQQSFDAAAGLGSTMSLTAYATSSIGWLGSQAQRIEKIASYQKTVLQQAQQALSNATGVNLDEEMAKMLAIENSYQASTRLLATINAMYSILLDAIRN